jgi:hypothetical protein
MKILKLVATLMSLAVVGLGILGISAPAVLLELGRSLLSPAALYGVAAVRVVFGGLLISVATASRLPRALRVIGVFIVVAGLLTPLFGTERSVEAFTWLSGQGLLFVRVIAIVPVLLGIFLLYAINAHRRGLA